MVDRDMAGRRLRELLAEAGWSPETFARRITEHARRQRLSVSVHEKTPYHWLRDGRCPHQPVPELAAAALSDCLGRAMTPADLGWQPSRSSMRRADDGLACMWVSGGTIRGLEEVASGVQRRAFLALTGTALTAVAHQWMVLDLHRLTAVLDGGRRIDEELVTQFEQLTDVRRRMDDTLGGGAIYDAVAADLRMVVRLLKTGTYTEELGTRLYSVAAEFARLAGWACFEQHHGGAAQRYWVTALRAAHEADNPQLGARILDLMAIQARDTSSPADAVTLLMSALAMNGLGAAQQASLNSDLARSYGYLGETSAVTRHIDKSFALLESAQHADSPTWFYWFDRSHLTGRAGEALLALGKATPAVSYLQPAMADLDTARLPRTGALWLTRLATAQLRAGNAEQAVATAHQAIDLADALNSDRVRSLVNDFSREARTTAPTAVTRELVERTRTAQL